MVGRKTNHWSKEADQALLNLLKIYGDHKWAEVARQLKEIYCFEYTPNIVLQRWNRINPQSYKRTWNHEEELEFLDLIKKYGNDWNKIQCEMAHRTGNQLRARFYSIFRRTFRKLNLIIGKIKNINKNKIENIKPAVFMKLLSLAHEPDPESKDEDASKDLYPHVIKSSKKLILLIEVVFKSENWNNRALVYEQLLKLTDRDEVQVMFEHLFLLNTMHQIEHSMILPQEKYQQQQTIQMREESIFKRRAKMCGVRTWDEADALIEPYNMQSETDEEEIDAEDTKQFKYKDLKQEFNQQEIQLLKESPLYKKLFQNERKQFFDMYNSALQPKHENKFQLNYQDLSMVQVAKAEEQFEVKSEQTKKKRFLKDEQNRIYNTRGRQKRNQQHEKDHGLDHYDDSQACNRSVPRKKNKPKNQQLQRISNPTLKLEARLRQTKRAKQTFRDRYTMFRDEDYMKQEQEEQQYTYKRKTEIINNGDQLQNLFDEIIEVNVEKKQITKKQENLFDEDFSALFGL